MHLRLVDPLSKGSDKCQMTNKHFRLSGFIQGMTVWPVIHLTVVVRRVRGAAGVHPTSLLTLSAPSGEGGQGTCLVTRTTSTAQSLGARLGPFCLSEMAQGSSQLFKQDHIPVMYSNNSE